MDFFLTLQNVSILFLLILIGFAAGKLKVISPMGQKEITNLVLYVTMPATIIMAMQVPFSKDKVYNILQLLMIMILAYLGMILISRIVVSLFKSSPQNHKDIFQTSMILSNTSFMGYPIIETLLGKETLFYAVICAGFIFEIVSWTLGTYLIGRSSSNHQGQNLKKAILNPGVISILIGGTLFLTNISIPQPFNATMTMLSKATSPLAMIVVGLILSGSKIGDAFKNIKIYIVTLFKLVVNPLLIFFVLRLFNFESTTLILPVMILSMPTAAYVAMFADNLGNDKNLAGQIVFICSLASLITIPLIASIIL